MKSVETFRDLIIMMMICGLNIRVARIEKDTATESAWVIGGLLTIGVMFYFAYSA